MDSSTSRRGFPDRGLRLLLFAGLAGTPLIWLTNLQAGYTLAYQACDTRSNSWVIVPTLAAIALTSTIALATWVGHRRSRERPLPMPLLGALASGMSALMVIVLLATAIVPFVLRPCD